MAMQIDDHRAATGPELVDRFASRWPRTVDVRQGRPGPLRRIKIDPGIPGLGRVPFGYLLDVIYNRDLWMHRVDLARATSQPFVIGGHDRHIVAQPVRDLALQWTARTVAPELAGPAGDSWLIGSGDPTAIVRVDAVTYLRARAGRDTDVALAHFSGDQTAVALIRQATIPF